MNLILSFPKRSRDSALAPVVNKYVCTLCHKRRAEMKEQMMALYEVAQEVGTADFVAALELAAEQQMYGAEYVRAIVALPTASAPTGSAETSVKERVPALPAQHEGERDLAQYEHYAANRDRVQDLLLIATGGQG